MKILVKQYVSRFWMEWGKPFLMIAIIIVTFRSAVADWNDVPSGSMKPTILEGDRIFVNKIAYGLRIPLTLFHLLDWEGPQRGDIVVFKSPYDGTRLVKRVIGLPGDRIEYIDEHLFINGQSAEYRDFTPSQMPAIDTREPVSYEFQREKYGSLDHPVMWLIPRRLARPFGPITLSGEEYFMMGDNRDESFDSRYFGVVNRRLILGKVNGVVMSLNPERYYLPRWDRFFQGLY